MIQGTLYPLQKVANALVDRRTMWSRPETLAVGELFPRPPVDLAGAVAGTSPCPSLDPAAVAETAQMFPPYSLARHQTVQFVVARGATSRRHTGPPVIGKDLPGGEQACFPMAGMQTTKIWLRA
jgi:hypothetical protein